MLRLVSILAVCVVLSGCGRLGKAPEPFATAVEAYVGGDREALHAAGLEARDFKARVLTGANSADLCEKLTPDLRREAFSALIVEQLDKPTVMSMSEPARYLYFNSAARAFREMNVLVSEVDGSCGGMKGAIGDIATLSAMRDVMLTADETWRRKLKVEYGEELDIRLEEARKLLGRNGYRVRGWRGDF
jgi:hypothetical protein